MNFTENAEYIINVKNNATGKVARYEAVKIFSDELGELHQKTNLLKDAFSKTLN